MRQCYRCGKPPEDISPLCDHCREETSLEITRETNLEVTKWIGPYKAMLYALGSINADIHEHGHGYKVDGKVNLEVNGQGIVHIPLDVRFYLQGKAHSLALLCHATGQGDMI